MQRAAHASGPSASWLWDPVDIGGFHEHPPYIGNNSTIICIYIYTGWWFGTCFFSMYRGF